MLVVWTSGQDGSGRASSRSVTRRGRAARPGSGPTPSPPARSASRGGGRPFRRFRGHVDERRPGWQRPGRLRAALRRFGGAAGRRVPRQHVHHGVPVQPRGVGESVWKRLRRGVAGRRRARRWTSRARRVRPALRGRRPVRSRVPGRDLHHRFPGRAGRRRPGRGGLRRRLAQRRSGRLGPRDLRPALRERRGAVRAGVPRNAFTTGAQASPALGVDSAGCFFIAWTSDDGSGTGIFGQSYILGNPTEPQYRVNTFTTGNQARPSAAQDTAIVGTFVIAWDSQGQDGSGDGVFARIDTTTSSPSS